MIQIPELDYLPFLGRDIHPFFSSSNLLAQQAATAQGFGLCILPCFLAKDDARLERVLGDTVSLTRSFHMIAHSDIRELVRIQIVLKFIAAEVQANQQIFI